MSTNFNKKSTLLITFAFALLFITSGCEKNKLKIDVSTIQADITFRRFDKDLISIDTQNIEQGFIHLEQQYPEFFPSYYTDLIEWGHFADSIAPYRLKDFLAMPDTKTLFAKVEKKFASVDEYNAQIVEIFKHYKYYYPNEALPQVIYFPGTIKYGCVNYGKMVAVGLDMYLHNDYPYQAMPHLTNYLIEKMRPEYIARNVINAYGTYKFEPYLKGRRFLDQMVHEGKLAYFLDAMMPDAPDSIKLGLNSKNLKWCEENEWQIWKHFVDPELKVLYNTDPELIIRYFEEGPFTNANGVPNEGEKSSPRFAVWTGREIVRRYMKNNSDVTLVQLMQETDSDKIMKESKYRP